MANILFTKIEECSIELKITLALNTLVFFTDKHSSKIFCSSFFFLHNNSHNSLSFNLLIFRTYKSNFAWMVSEVPEAFVWHFDLIFCLEEARLLFQKNGLCFYLTILYYLKFYLFLLVLLCITCCSPSQKNFQ